VLGSIFLRSWFTNNLRQPQTACNNSWWVRPDCGCRENAHQAEFVETMSFQHNPISQHVAPKTCGLALPQVRISGTLKGVGLRSNFFQKPPPRALH
jgi:hypothetical protein